MKNTQKQNIKFKIKLLQTAKKILGYFTTNKFLLLLKEGNKKNIEKI